MPNHVIQIVKNQRSALKDKESNQEDDGVIRFCILYKCTLNMAVVYRAYNL